MPQIATVGSETSGHDGYPGTRIITGIDRFTINGKAVAVVGSKCEDHDKPYGVRHTPIVSEGCSKFTINGIEIAYVGCSVDKNICSGNKIVTGNDHFTINIS